MKKSLFFAPLTLMACCLLQGSPRAGSATPTVQEKLKAAEEKNNQLVLDNAKLQETVAQQSAPSNAPITTPEAALAELKAGNQRFMASKRVRTLLSTQDESLRETLSKGQSPFAVVFTCSDSRMMDNIIFDQELGRLFTIREAGNCADTQGIASAEYAVDHLGSSLVVVMGHSACGAVKAVAESGDKPLPGNLWSLQAAMAGLAEATPEDPNETRKDRIRRMEINNAKRQAQVLIDRSPIIRQKVENGKVKVVAAYYDLKTGKVDFFEPLTVQAPKVAGHH